MQLRSFFACIAGALLWLVCGCAAPPAPSALEQDHPANPRAAESPLPAPSGTLLLGASPLASTQPAAARYTCPMHKQVVLDHPGTCPICRMKLVPLAAATQPAAATHSTHDHGAQ